MTRERAVVWGGVGVLTLSAWGYLLYLHHGMSGDVRGATAPWTAVDLGFAVVMWAVMMVGMMLPAASPVIRLFATANARRRARDGVAVPTGLFVLGYLLVWGGFSVAAALAQWGLHAAALLSPALTTTSPLVGGGLLVAAGVWQLTPLKQACLARCRNPVAWLMTAWRDGAGGALAMGVRHGTDCLGCCGALMGLLFVAGVMNLLWVAAISAFVLVEKVAPGGVWEGRAASGLLIGAGVLLASSGGGR
jgi:predicted metal-binding membrane protein